MPALPSPAVLSLLALLLAIVLSCTSRVNVGLLSIALAWLIGVYASGWKPDAVVAGFPSSLFLTLTGVTLLFALAQANGALGILAQHAVRLCRGKAALLPLLFFTLALGVSTVGPGAIASVALVAPMAMAIGARAGVPAFLSALAVANGANAGNLSPVSSVGIIVNTLMATNGLGGHEWKVWAANFAAHALVTVAAYWLFGGVPLLRAARAAGHAAAAEPTAPLERRHWLVIVLTALWVLGVVGLKLNPGLAAFGAITVLVLVQAADEREAMRLVPWSVIVMVTGVTLLIAVLERTGGLELFTSLLARLATPRTIDGVIAFVTGVISTYSSTSGVVLPAFLPTVPGLVHKIGGGDPLAVALSINVGSAMVDVSPLSTLGALCVAASPPSEDPRLLFRRLLLWGLSMAVVGAVLCQLFAGAFARA